MLQITMHEACVRDRAKACAACRAQYDLAALFIEVKP